MNAFLTTWVQSRTPTGSSTIRVFSSGAGAASNSTCLQVSLRPGFHIATIRTGTGTGGSVKMIVSGRVRSILFSAVIAFSLRSWCKVI